VTFVVVGAKNKLVKIALWDWGKSANTMPDGLVGVVVVVMGAVGVAQSVILRKALTAVPSYTKLDGGGGAADIESPAPSEAAALPTLTPAQLFRILKPYFWPSRRSEDWIVNRVRCCCTWIAVAG